MEISPVFVSWHWHFTTFVIINSGLNLLQTQTSIYKKEVLTSISQTGGKIKESIWSELSA